MCLFIDLLPTLIISDEFLYVMEENQADKTQITFSFLIQSLTGALT